MKKLIICILLAGCAGKTALIPSQPTARIEFTAPDTYPEGVAYDSIGNMYYVTSAKTGTVGKVSPQGQYTPLYTDAVPRSSYGIKVHSDGKRVFVCLSDANYSKYSTPDTKKKMARLVGIDMATGQKVSDTDLSMLKPGNHFANDLTFDDKGNAYITDSFANVIYKVDASGMATVFADSPLFKTEGVGLNGIVWHKNGYLLVSSSGAGAVYKVPLNNSSNVTKVMSDQFFMNADGLLLNNSNTLTLVQNGGSDKIYKLQSNDDFSSVKLIESTLLTDRFTYPSTATKVKDEVWVMNAKFSEIVDSTSVPSMKFAIQNARFVPLAPKKK